MKIKKILPFFVFLLVFSTSLLAEARPDQEPMNDSTIRVIVRFAKVRGLPDAKAKIIKQLGFGTMLRVLAKSGEFYQVTALHVSPASVQPTWYILQSEVETVHTSPQRPLVENRLVTFEPLQPIAGQAVVFTALNFRTPNLLKWDMGDGTVLTSGSKSSQLQEARLAYAYPLAGTYLVKVYDDNGNLSLPPLTFPVTVAAFPRSLRINPEKPMANHPLTITALNFNTPENIYWDLGDGFTIKPGAENGILNPMFMITHTYTAAGTYTVKAYDNKGDSSLPPLSLGVDVAADPSLIKAEPEKTTVVSFDPNPVLIIPGDTTAKTDLVQPSQAPAPAKRYMLIKIGPYAGYFRPTFSKDKSLYDLFTKIYGDGDVIYGARLGVHVWQGFYFWLSAAQYKVIGKTTFTEEKTTLTVTPLNAFIRYSFDLGFFNPYAGIGFTYLSFKEESNNPTTSGNGSNAAFEGGFELKLNRHLFLDFGIRYEQIKVKPTGFEIDLGGLQAGVSLLVSF